MKLRNLIQHFIRWKLEFLVFAFFSIHLTFIVIIDDVIAFSPDELGYLYTFNNIYSWPAETTAQSVSGWITAPTLFLWIIYSPAKLLNIIGVDGLFALRLQSIALISFMLYCTLRAISKTFQTELRKLIFVTCIFCIPSIFFWTSTALRETYILVGLSLVFFGVGYWLDKGSKKALFMIIVGSYILISTKPYLWVILIIAFLMLILIQFLRKFNVQQLLSLSIATLLIPLTLFGATTSLYALNFIFNTNISDVGARSGDSVTLVETGVGAEAVLVKFRGDFTLVQLEKEYTRNPASIFSKVSEKIGLVQKVKDQVNSKLETALNSQSKETGNSSSTFNGHILETASLKNPLSIIKALLIFTLGPFPFVGDPTFAIRLASFESPVWWVLFIMVFMRVWSVSKKGLIFDSQLLLSTLFLLGFILFSALTQVNLGTAFRHRSVLIIPILTLLIRSEFLLKKSDA